MSTPILATKLFIPPPRLKVVSRPHLVARMNEGISSGRKLTLISAPAGFGKTTLASEWASGCGLPVTWLSLDEGDNDLARFLAYLIAALQTLDTNAGKGAMGMLQGSQSPPTEVILTTLLNEITNMPDHFILVLDDYHVIDDQLVDQALVFLVEHLPPLMHLVIATREDPPLPLARLRARGQMTELRAADLRFAPAEAAEFLNAGMGLNLSAEDISALEARTEGWITGLQLAAISMQGRVDTNNFIQAFAGSHRFILDYLVEEVLHRQPEHIRSFLLQTSILDRLSGPLCDAVTGQKDGRETMDALERGNLFIVPLDDKRQWYRYHHLFAEVLYSHLMEAQPDQVSSLQRRASMWYEQNGLPSDAIRLAIAAGDYERAAGLIELAYPTMDISFQSATWLGWVKELPDELIRTRPVLSVDFAWALTDLGEFEVGESWLRDAEQLLDLMSGGGEQSQKMIVVDKEQFRSLPARIAQARAYHAMAQGDIPGTMKYSKLVLDLSPEEDLMSRAGAAVQLGIAYWANGDLEDAHSAMTDWVNHNQKVGNILFVIASTFVLADIRVAQGRLHEAIQAYQQALQLTAEHDQPVQQVMAPLYLGLGLLYHEMGEQETATQYLEKSSEFGELTTVVDWPCRWRLAQARLKEAEGDLEAALDLLNEAKRVYVRNPVPDLRPIESLKARVWIKQGRLTEALGWARKRCLSVDDELSYLNESEHITLARVLYQRDQAGVIEAIGLLDRLLKAAEEGARQGSVIEILVVQALALQAQGNVSRALASLERALALAEPEGYIRIFVDEGLPMVQLLSKALAQGVMPDYTDKLLAVFSAEKPNRGDKSNSPSVHPEGHRDSESLIEPLSQREMEILQLIAKGLSNHEISERLFLALSTVKGHNLKIFGKLQVQRRTEAVARARELDLL